VSGHHVTATGETVEYLSDNDRGATPAPRT
jgi:hypothetical protein